MIHVLGLQYCLAAVIRWLVCILGNFVQKGNINVVNTFVSLMQDQGIKLSCLLGHYFVTACVGNHQEFEEASAFN